MSLSSSSSWVMGHDSWKFFLFEDNLWFFRDFLGLDPICCYLKGKKIIYFGNWMIHSSQLGISINLTEFNRFSTEFVFQMVLGIRLNAERANAGMTQPSFYRTWLIPWTMDLHPRKPLRPGSSGKGLGWGCGRFHICVSLGTKNGKTRREREREREREKIHVLGKKVIMQMRQINPLKEHIIKSFRLFYVLSYCPCCDQKFVGKFI